MLLIVYIDSIVWISQSASFLVTPELKLYLTYAKKTLAKK